MVKERAGGRAMTGYWAQWVLSALAVLATAAAVLIWGLGDGTGWPLHLLRAIWGGWVLLPPVWFLWEWTRYPGGAGFQGDPDRGVPSFETFKYSQELASKVWAAGVVVLSAILASGSGIIPGAG